MGVGNRSKAGLTLSCDLRDGLQVNLFTYKPAKYADDITLETIVIIGSQQARIHMRYNSYTRKHSKDGIALFVWDVKTRSDQDALEALLRSVENAETGGTISLAMSGTPIREVFSTAGATDALRGFPLDCNAQL